jgi:hypothetical protein
MAFLDNSGDIILDAVLTDVGRRRMAQGSFKITKYAFGDDEIDYSLYNKDHVSGSAYYDLDILQTPIFEAFAYANVGLTYGLTSYAKTDLLYLPELKMNQVTTDQSVNLTGSVMYLAANAETAKALKDSSALGDAKYFLESNSSTGYKMVIESGLDTTDLTGDSSNRSSYLAANNLIDSSFNVYFDNRFVANSLTPTAGSRFSNGSDGTDKVSIKMRTSNGTSKASGLENYSTSTAIGMNNTVYNVSVGGSSDTDVSALSGPRGSATGVNFKVMTGLDTDKSGTRDTKFTKYGNTGVDLFGDSKTYDYIDTEVIIEGATTGARLTQILRIVRRVT